MPGKCRSAVFAGEASPEGQPSVSCSACFSLGRQEDGAWLRLAGNDMQQLAEWGFFFLFYFSKTPR